MCIWCHSTLTVACMTRPAGVTTVIGRPCRVSAVGVAPSLHTVAATVNVGCGWLV